jgi:hypothetical protein
MFWNGGKGQVYLNQKARSQANRPKLDKYDMITGPAKYKLFPTWPQWALLLISRACKRSAAVSNARTTGLEIVIEVVVRSARPS